MRSSSSQQYGRSIPIELDESARIDGASPMQVYFRIYLPLMAPALVAVGTYALLLAWNEYLYQFLLLSNKRSMTVPVALAQFLNSDRGAVELHDGDGHRLCVAADRHLLRVPPPHDRRPDHGWCEGLARWRALCSFTPAPTGRWRCTGAEPRKS